MTQAFSDTFTEEQVALREGVAKVCARFDDSYWLDKDNKHEFPFEFAQAMADAGWLGVVMPERYGGAGLGITGGCIVMQTVAEQGGAAAGCSAIHINMFGPMAMVQHGTEAQRERWVNRLISLKDRACFGVTEPGAGIDTTRLACKAEWDPKRKSYIVSGQKTWTSTAQHANKIMLIARTTPVEKCARPQDGISLFYADLDKRHAEVREIEKMGRHAVDSNQVFFDGMPIPRDDLIGEEGKGFYYMLDSMNAERIVVAAEAVGIGRMAIRRAAKYAQERIVFGRPIGMNQAIQHPLAETWCRLEAANLLAFKAAALFDAGRPCGAEANAAKWFATEEGYKACEHSVMTHGGMGYAKEFHVERYLREMLPMRIGAVPPQLALCYIAERLLGLPKSY